MDEQFNIILETQYSGLHLLVATSSTRHLAVLVAESLYNHTNTAPSHKYKASSVFVCDVTNPQQKQIIALWPLREVEPEAHQAALLRLAEYPPFSE